MRIHCFLFPSDSWSARDILGTEAPFSAQLQLIAVDIDTCHEEEEEDEDEDEEEDEGEERRKEKGEVEEKPETAGGDCMDGDNGASEDKKSILALNEEDKRSPDASSREAGKAADAGALESDSSESPIAGLATAGAMSGDADALAANSGENKESPKSKGLMGRLGEEEVDIELKDLEEKVASPPSVTKTSAASSEAANARTTASKGNTSTSRDDGGENVKDENEKVNFVSFRSLPATAYRHRRCTWCLWF